MIQCRICASNNTEIWSRVKDYEYFTTEQIYTYHKCRDCETVFIDKTLTDQLSIIYPSNYYSFKEHGKSIAESIKQWLDKRLFKKILSQIPGNTINIVDIGGGTGWLLDLIKDIDPRVNITQVVDIDSDAKSLAEEKGHQYFLGRAEDFKSSIKFDLILMLNLIEHVDTPHQILKNLQENLSEHGRILIKTPNIESWDAYLFRDSFWGGLHVPRHWHIFSKKGFNILLEGTGLKIHDFKYTQGAPFWACSMVAKMHDLGLLKISKEAPIFYKPIYKLFILMFAAIDFIRGIFFKTSQMFLILNKK